MRTILHLQTRPADELTRQLIEHQRALPDTELQVVDLTGDISDYEALVEKIFQADSVEVF